MTEQTFEHRHATMRQNAGDWLLKNRNALFVCQSVLIEKYYATAESDATASPDLACFLQEIQDVIDLYAGLIADLRDQAFWPAQETAQ